MQHDLMPLIIAELAGVKLKLDLFHDAFFSVDEARFQFLLQYLETTTSTIILICSRLLTLDGEELLCRELAGVGSAPPLFIPAPPRLEVPSISEG